MTDANHEKSVWLGESRTQRFSLSLVGIKNSGVRFTKPSLHRKHSTACVLTHLCWPLWSLLQGSLIPTAIPHVVAPPDSLPTLREKAMIRASTTLYSCFTEFDQSIESYSKAAARFLVSKQAPATRGTSVLSWPSQ